MLTKEQEKRQAIEMLCTDMLVPQDHLLRKIDAAVDFKHTGNTKVRVTSAKAVR